MNLRDLGNYLKRFGYCKGESVVQCYGWTTPPRYAKEE